MSDTNYTVWFAFKENADDKKFSQATTQVTTDNPINSLEGVNDVSRAIGLQHGYAAVYIVTTIPPVENLDEIISQVKGTFGQVPEGRLIEGDIVE